MFLCIILNLATKPKTVGSFSRSAHL